jgi:hypothetical protein
VSEGKESMSGVNTAFLKQEENTNKKSIQR